MGDENVRKAIAYLNLVLTEPHGFWERDRDEIRSTIRVLQGLVRNND